VICKAIAECFTYVHKSGYSAKDVMRLVNGQMTTAKFRRQLLAKGLVIEDDQDVFHIIASANGGADHVDNYAFLGNSVLNIKLGCKNDDIVGWMTGLQKLKKAVAVSNLLGNRKGLRPVDIISIGKPLVAEDIYNKGQKAGDQWLRDRRREFKNTNKGM